MISIPIGVPQLSIAEAVDSGPQKAETTSRLHRFCDECVLGTRLEVLVHAQSGALAQGAASAARREIERLNQVFNHRRDDSEISRLNKARRLHVSADLFAVVQVGELWRQITRGAFDGRMGALLRLWTDRSTPHPRDIEQALAGLRDARITLDPVERSIELSSAVELSLDAIAKGHIVDAALNAARRAAPTIDGLAISIGGDIRCWGKSPDSRGWRVGIPDSKNPAENAPLVDAVRLQNAAIATSGRGPRDCIGNGFRSTTISPFTGRPVRDVISATVVASHTADADAIATACLVHDPKRSIALANALDGVATRITDAGGHVHESSRWPSMRLAAAPTPNAKTPNANAPSLPPELRWPNDWELGMTYLAPERQQERNADFRTPYMVLWITDMQNRPVRTVLMVGTDAEWQRDNFVWWGSHRERAPQLVDLRSQATALSGRYPMYWPGVDDDWKPVPLGKYILHLETSQERGKHSYRSMPIELGRERFKTELPNLTDAGGLQIRYGHYNDRFNND